MPGSGAFVTVFIALMESSCVIALFLRGALSVQWQRYICVCVCVCGMYVCVYVRVYVCIYMHILIYIVYNYIILGKYKII